MDSSPQIPSFTIQSQGAIYGAAYAGAYLYFYQDMYLFGHKGVVVPHVERIENWSWTFRFFMRPMAVCAGISATYAGVELITETIRGVEGKENPWWNNGAGGLVAGTMIGGLTRRIDYACAVGAALGILMTGIGYGQYCEMNKKNWDENEKPVSNVTEETFKARYPEYKDV